MGEMAWRLKMMAPKVQQIEEPGEYPRPRQFWVASMLDGAERPGWLQWSGYSADDNDALLALQNAASQVWPVRYTLRHPIFDTADRVVKRFSDDGEDRKPHSLTAQYVDGTHRPSASSEISTDAASRETARNLKSLLKPLLLVDPRIYAAIQSGQPVSVEWAVHSAHFYTGQTRVSASISARTHGGTEIELSLVNCMLALLFDELDRHPVGFQLRSSFDILPSPSAQLRPWRILKFASDRARLLENPGADLGKVLFRLHFKHRSALAERFAEIVKDQRLAARQMADWPVISKRALA
jgi:hypothetical protein